jgi:hypothetical protein
MLCSPLLVPAEDPVEDGHQHHASLRNPLLNNRQRLEEILICSSILKRISSHFSRRAEP